MDPQTTKAMFDIPNHDINIVWCSKISKETVDLWTDYDMSQILLALPSGLVLSTYHYSITSATISR